MSEKKGGRAQIHIVMQNRWTNIMTKPELFLLCFMDRELEKKYGKFLIVYGNDDKITVCKKVEKGMKCLQ